MVPAYHGQLPPFAPVSLLGPTRSSNHSHNTYDHPLTPPATAPGSPVDSFPFSPLPDDHFSVKQPARSTLPSPKAKGKRSELPPPIRAMRKKKSRGALPVDAESKSDQPLPSRFTAASPRRMQFPTILSSDEEGNDEGERDWNHFGFTSPTKGAAKGEKAEETSPGLSRTYSTTTKRTEHRSWTYSTSSIRAEEVARAAAEVAPRQDRQRSASHTPVDSLPSSRTVPFPTLPSASRTTSTTNRTLRDYKSTSNLKDDSEYARRGTKSFNAERSFQRIFDPPVSPYVDPLEGYHIPSNSTRSPYLSPPLRNRFVPPTAAEPPFLQPIVNTFLVLLFSTIACCSISAVLFASFTLTAYDDFGRRIAHVKDRWGQVQGSIGGARSGVGRMIEGAVGALGIVSWATGSGKGLRRSFDIRRKGWSSSNGLSDPTKSRWRNFGRNVGTGANSPRKRTMSPANRRSTSTHSTSSSRLNPTSSSSPIVTPYNVDPPVDVSPATWPSDSDSEDPFVVPHSTPRESRTPSAFVSEDEFSDSSAPSRRRKSSAASNGSLPPRPPLLILIPSIFALIFLTLWKLITNLRSKRG